MAIALAERGATLPMSVFISVQHLEISNATIMTYEPLRVPLYGTDDRGLPVVRVPLASVNAHAIIDVADYEALMALGVSPNWSFDGRIVRVGFRPGNTRRVARLIMDPPDEVHQVRHRNRNALDLRRSNLFLKRINRHSRPDITGQHRPL